MTESVHYIVATSDSRKYLKGREISGVNSSFTMLEREAYVFNERNSAQAAVDLLNINWPDITFEIQVKFSDLNKEIKDLCGM